MMVFFVEQLEENRERELICQESILVRQTSRDEWARMEIRSKKRPVNMT